MAGDDRDTLQFYAREAEKYANRDKDRSYRHLDAFLKRLHQGCSILELGCGGGDDSAYMLAKGFAVTPTDGSPELAREAHKRLGLPVLVRKFHEFDDHNEYDAVWASACLLHVPRAGLPDVLLRIRRALTPGGLFFASYKAGSEEGRDTFGRYYNYPSRQWLRSAYGAGWQTIEITGHKGGGYDNQPTEWLHVITMKDADPCPSGKDSLADNRR
ncbi:MAG: class I SAM-dependent methyltransferase [Phyllobacterium sp.]